MFTPALRHIGRTLPKRFFFCRDPVKEGIDQKPPGIRQPLPEAGTVAPDSEGEMWRGEVCFEGFWPRRESQTQYVAFTHLSDAASISIYPNRLEPDLLEPFEGPLTSALCRVIAFAGQPLRSRTETGRRGHGAVTRGPHGGPSDDRFSGPAVWKPPARPRGLAEKASVWPSEASLPMQPKA